MFAASIFLLALPLVFLPFIIKWIKTGKPKEVIFSQMYLLQKALKSHKELQRRSPLLLYIIRMLQILMLVFIVAGLLMKTDALSSSNAVMIICDDSFYMHAKNRSGQKLWDLAKIEIEEVLDRLDTDAQVSYVGFSGESSPWLSVDSIRERLEEKNLNFKDENWSLLRRNVKNLLRERTREKVDVILVSTSKATDLDSFKKVFQMFPDGRFKEIKIADSLLKNIALDLKTFKIKDEIIFKGKINGAIDQKVSVVITNQVGKKISRQVSPAKEFMIKIKDPSFENGVFKIEVNDRFAFDNEVYYKNHDNDKLSVTILSFSESVSRLKDVQYYLENGFKTLQRQTPFLLTIKKPSQWKYFDKKTDVLIMHDPPFLSREDWELFKDYVFKGGELLLIPGPQTPVELFTKEMWSILPAELKERTVIKQKLNLNKEWERNCPRFSGSELRAKWIFHRLKRSSESLFTFSDGSPFWVKNGHGKGNIHLISSPFSMYWAHTVLYHDFTNVLYTMLNTVKKDWASSNQVLKLSASYRFPKEITSYKKILGINNNSDIVLPGLYLCQTKEKNNLPLVCNFSSKNISRRYVTNIEAWVNSEQEKITAYHYSRMDKSMAFILLLLLISESLVFVSRSKR